MTDPSIQQIAELQDLLNKTTKQITDYQTQIETLRNSVPKTEAKLCLKYTSLYIKNMLLVILGICLLVFGALFGLSYYRSRFNRPYQIYKLIFTFLVAPMLFTGVLVNYINEPINKMVGNIVVGLFSVLALLFLATGVYLGVVRKLKIVTFIMLSLSFSCFGIVGIVKHKMDFFD
jgi:hypothetical protein